MLCFFRGNENNVLWITINELFFFTETTNETWEIPHVVLEINEGFALNQSLGRLD